MGTQKKKRGRSGSKRTEKLKKYSFTFFFYQIHQIGCSCNLSSFFYTNINLQTFISLYKYKWKIQSFIFGRANTNTELKYAI